MLVTAPTDSMLCAPSCASTLQGQLLGVGGKQLQRIKQESSARVEVVNAQGNLNGAHPDPLDLDLHALITADSMVSADEQRVGGQVPISGWHLPITQQPGSCSCMSLRGFAERCTVYHLPWQTLGRSLLRLARSVGSRASDALRLHRGCLCLLTRDVTDAACSYSLLSCTHGAFGGSASFLQA